MLAEIYIEALLVDEELADQVWQAWDNGEIDDSIACTAWMIIARKNAGLDPVVARYRAPAFSRPSAARAFAS